MTTENQYQSNNITTIFITKNKNCTNKKNHANKKSSPLPGKAWTWIIPITTEDLRPKILENWTRELEVILALNFNAWISYASSFFCVSKFSIFDGRNTDYFFFLVNHMDISALMLTFNNKNYVILFCIDSRWQVINEAWRLASKVSHQAPNALCGLTRPLVSVQGSTRHLLESEEQIVLNL